MRFAIDAWRSRENAVASVVGLTSFLVYLSTMNPTISFIDSGELAAVASMLGIAHPTGYPLFTLVGRLAVLVPVGEEIQRLNVVAALIVAVSMAWFYKLILQLEKRTRLFPSRGQKEGTVWDNHLAAFSGSLVLAFSTSVWSQSVAIEVYSFHLLFLVLIISVFLRGMEDITQDPRQIPPLLILFAFLLGLSFSNHMTTLLLAPAFFYVYFAAAGFSRKSFFRLILLAPWFVLGLSVYLYLPLRSGSNPPLGWGHPADFERFLWHITGKQYRSWIFSSVESAEKQLKYFGGHFTAEFHWAAVVVMALGVWSMLWGRRRLVWFLGLLIVGCLAYSVNYDIHDIDSYFLLAYVAAGVFMAAGIREIGLVVPRPWRALVLAVAFGLPLLQWWNNHQNVDESDNYLVHDYTHNILSALDSNAVVFTYQWDYLVSASYYAQLVKRDRPDVTIIDKELLRRSWYYLQLERNAPWLVARSRDRIHSFLNELYKFEHNLPYDGAMIEARYNEMINDFIDKSFADRPVYLGPEMEAQFAPAYERVPETLFLRLARPGAIQSLRPFHLEFRPARYQSRLTRGLLTQYAVTFTLRAVWLKNHGSLAEALETAKKALKFDPTFSPAITLEKELRGA